MPSLTRQALERAQQLLASPSSPNLAYAALELRIVMEMVTYEKLVAAKDLIPPEVLRTWQPPQAAKALLEFQEYADQSFVLEIADTPNDPEEFEHLSEAEQLEHLKGLNYVKVGEHHALTLAWLKKNYNKIGNLLHAPAPGTSPKTPGETAKYLSEVASELDLALRSTIFTFTESGGWVFPCHSCGTPVIRNVEALKAGAVAVCSKAQCDAEYRLVKTSDDTWTVQPIQTKFTCPGCAHESVYWPRKIKVGAAFVCPGCQRRFGVFDYTWQVKELGPDEVMK